jgi:hypothetical protein
MSLACPGGPRDRVGGLHDHRFGDGQSMSM